MAVQTLPVVDAQLDARVVPQQVDELARELQVVAGQDHAGA